MDTSEQQRFASLLATYFPGRVPKETALLWSDTLKGYDYAHAAEGLRDHARQHAFPSLADIEGAIRAVMKRKADDRRMRTPAIPATTERDAESIRRSHIACGVTMDVVGRVIPEAMFDEEMAHRLTLSDEGIKARRAELRNRRASEPRGE